MKVFLFLTLLCATSAFAKPGNDAGGGGDAVALDFTAQGAYIRDLFVLQPEAMPDAADFSLDRFREAVANTRVESTTERLRLGSREVDAINYPGQQLIQVNRPRWFAASKRRFAQTSLVLHEYLGILGVNDDGYRLSSRFLAWLEANAMPPRRGGGEPARDAHECVSGQWVFGRAPLGCRAAEYGPDSAVLLAYADHIFYDERNPTIETKRYVTTLYATVKEAALTYLDSREKASPEARAAWLRLVLSTSQTESTWSQYRLAQDGKLKLHLGDDGHQRGLLGLDDRSQKDADAWDLVTNLRLGMDILYNQWTAAASAPCVKQDGTARARARAAWSAYNGGTSKICRWANPQDVWYRNDLGFATAYDAQAWRAQVTDENARSTLNIPCLLGKGVRGCENPRR